MLNAPLPPMNPPTAHTSSALLPQIPNRPLIVLLATCCHATPSQCMTEPREPAPTAHTSSGAVPQNASMELAEGTALCHNQTAGTTVRVWVATALPEPNVIWKDAAIVGVKENCAPVPVKSSNAERASQVSAQVSVPPAAGRSLSANANKARTMRTPPRLEYRGPRRQMSARRSAASSHR